MDPLIQRVSWTVNSRRGLVWRALSILGSLAILVSQFSTAYACAVSNGVAYQASLRDVASTLEAAAANRLGTSYPSLPPLETGNPQTGTIEAPVPCVVTKAIAYVESSWRQAVWSVPDGGSGPVKMSPSCGYGIMQITSGMHKSGALPPDVQGKIATDYKYNIAWGAQMLAHKWNAAPSFIPPIGNRDPSAAENWYYTVWAYNGWLIKNNPNNPDLPWPRPTFNGTQSYTNYPYQELVWGYAANPPRADGKPLWEAVPLTLPRREDVGVTPQPLATPQPAHKSTCQSVAPPSTVAPTPDSQAPTSIKIAPDAISVMAWSGSVTTPKEVSLIAGNSSSSTPWRATTSAEWINVSPTSGTRIPAVIKVSANASSLAPGTYIGSVNVSINKGTEALTIPVELKVVKPGGVYLPIITRGR